MWTTARPFDQHTHTHTPIDADHNVCVWWGSVYLRVLILVFVFPWEDAASFSERNVTRERHEHLRKLTLGRSFVLIVSGLCVVCV